MGNGDLPIKRDDHALDELRYYIMSKPTYAPPKPKPTIYELNYRKLYRQAKNGG